MNTEADMKIWNWLKSLFRYSPRTPMPVGKIERIGIIGENGEVYWFYPQRKEPSP